MSLESGLALIATIITQIIVFAIAFRELRKWKTELLGTKKIELAMEIGRLSLQIKDALKRIRSHVMDQMEPAPEYPPDADEKERQEIDKRYTWSKRVRHIADLLLELDELNWEAEIILGENISNLIREYRDQLNTIWLAINDRHFADYQLDPAERRKSLQILYGQSGDDLDKKIDATSQALRDFARKHVK